MLFLCFLVTRDVSAKRLYAKRNVPIDTDRDPTGYAAVIVNYMYYWIQSAAQYHLSTSVHLIVNNNNNNNGIVHC